VTHHLEAVPGTCPLQGPDHRLGQTFVEFHEACAISLDPERGSIGRLRRPIARSSE
jgi:hypothetical protein